MTGSRAVLAALHDATLRDALWPHVSALIDEACGATGNAIVVSEGTGTNARIRFRAGYYRGERNEELEAYYFRHYHYRDERVPRLWQLPDGRLAHVPDLYTEQEKRTSPAYNEALPRTGDGNGVAVRLDGPDGTRITWTFANPSQSEGWGTGQTDMIERLIPHVRQFVRVRQALAKAQALNSSLSALLDNNRVGVVQLDRSGAYPGGQRPRPCDPAARRQPVGPQRYVGSPVAPLTTPGFRGCWRARSRPWAARPPPAR